jgi:poly-gamma-glutamate capsule biosynthesis protein CapA/YwtB (metallophosphatase superfamily)
VAQFITLFLCGDVMTGRGIDQILPHRVNPTLYEPYVRDAGEYVQLAEIAHGPIPRPVDFAYIWGDVLPELEGAGTDARIINLETSITGAEKPRPKGINYRMSPGNIGCLTATRIDCCCLANNHILDWGYEGLTETIETLNAAGIAHAGAGCDAGEAAAPAVLELTPKGRVLVFALGSPTSGVPCDWAATENRPGINPLETLSENIARRLTNQLCGFKRPGDVAVASIHWGGNWGYEISTMQIDFAHRLIDGGFDLVHGHSSHHVKALEVYRDRLILYGCGDFLTDYEGITGHEEFRGDLALMYLAKLDPGDGRLLELRMVPMQSRRFQLCRASAADAQWLCALLNNLGPPFATQVRLREDNSTALGWHSTG